MGNSKCKRDGEQKIDERKQQLMLDIGGTRNKCQKTQLHISIFTNESDGVTEERRLEEEKWCEIMDKDLHRQTLIKKLELIDPLIHRAKISSFFLSSMY